MSTINLPSDGSSDKLSIVVPVKGATNWADTLKDQTFEKIAIHDHSGSGSGDKISVQNLKERGSSNLGNTAGAFSDVLDDVSSTAILNLGGLAGSGTIIEYNVKDETTNFTQTGTLTIFYKGSSSGEYGLSDEYMGADIVDFQISSAGVLQYKGTAVKKMYYFIKKIGAV